LGDNALHIAMKSRNFVLSSLLLPLFPSGVDYPLMTPPWCRPVDASTETIAWTRPLHLATSVDLTLIQQLLSAGANINLLGSFGRSPLSYAIECGGKEAFKILLAHGADFMTPVRSLKTPLEESTLASSPTILDDLVELRPDLDLSSSFAARAGLKQAQIGSRWDTVRKLVERCLRKDQAGTVLDEEETLF
jgi:ankyrin repeat protein